MKNIILIGYMGCGKSTIGKQLAKALNYQFKDTDELIEAVTGEKISEIFASKGEEYFRKLETETLKNLQGTMTATVLSTGGGMPCREENVGLLHSIGMVIFLKVSKETVISRLKGDTTRPLLQGEDFETKIEQMLATRNPLYEKAADVVINTDQLSVYEVVDAVLKQRTRGDD